MELRLGITVETSENWRVRVKLCKLCYAGPRWVRVTTVEHGHGRSPTVAHGSEEPQVAGLRFKQLGERRREIQIVVPKVGSATSGQQMGSNRCP